MHSTIETTGQPLGASLGLVGGEATGTSNPLVLPDLGGTPVPVVDLMLEPVPNQVVGLVDARVGACGDLFNMVARDGGRRIPNGSLVEVGRLAPRLLQDRRSRVPLRLSWGFEVRDRGLREWCD